MMMLPSWGGGLMIAAFIMYGIRTGALSAGGSTRVVKHSREDSRLQFKNFKPKNIIMLVLLIHRSLCNRATGFSLFLVWKGFTS